MERKEERRKVRKMKVKVGTLNVGTMTGKGMEIADMMERRSVNILCVQETRWKGAKAINIGNGYKLWYYGTENRRNGVGIILEKDLVDRVVEVWRISDRLMCLKLEKDGTMLNIISAYAPQVGCTSEVKEAFWQDLEETVEKVPREERVVIGADLNGHVGEGNNGDEDIMGRHGLGRRNEEGQAVVDFAKRMRLAITNTFFVKKRADHRVTYYSGGHSSQVDYILVRRRTMKEVMDTKVVVGESVTTQHRLVVCKMVVRTKWRSEVKPAKRMKWWRLKDPENSSKFRAAVLESGVLDGKRNWQDVADGLRKAARDKLGVSSGKVNTRGNRETWWWNQEVQEAVKSKKEAKKLWDANRDEASKEVYKEAKKRAKQEVAKAKKAAFEDMYQRLETKDGANELFRIAKQRDRESQDVQHVRVIKNENGEVLMEEEKVKQRWKEYFDELLNQENPRETRETRAEELEREVEEISIEEVLAAMKKMKKGKAQGPDEIPVEAWLVLGEKGVNFLTKLFNRLLQGEAIPEEWRMSVLIPFFKAKETSRSAVTTEESS